MKKRLNDIQSMLGVDGSYRKSNKSDSETYEGRVLLTQYFIMKSDETVIIYVSSSNKLKLFSQFVPE
jgi:predicted NUDIX family phosphoesterase